MVPIIRIIYLNLRIVVKRKLKRQAPIQAVLTTTDTERADCQESTDSDTSDSTGINNTSSCTKSTHLVNINFPSKTVGYIAL